MLFSTFNGKFKHFLKVVTTYIAIEFNYNDFTKFFNFIYIFLTITFFSLFI